MIVLQGEFGMEKIEELTSVAHPEEQLAANSDLSDAARIEEEAIRSVVAE
jgi:hypothetical protein